MFPFLYEFMGLHRHFRGHFYAHCCIVVTSDVHSTVLVFRDTTANGYLRLVVSLRKCLLRLTNGERNLLPSGLTICLRNISFSKSRDSCNYMVPEFLEEVC